MIAISVVIPVYNAEKYLELCLESVRNQTLKNIEIICVDDGSTDNSLSIIQEMARRDERFIVITREKSSAGEARNCGMKIAKGKYLSFLDADDFFEEDMLEKAYWKAEKSETDIVVFRSDRYDEKLEDFTESYWTIKEEYLPHKNVFSHSDMGQIFTCFVGWAWDKLFRTSFIRRIGLKFQNQSSINDLFFVYGALAKAEKISVIDEILIHKRYNNEHSITSQYSKLGEWKCFYNALLALKNQLMLWQVYEELERDYVNYALAFTLWNLDKFRTLREYNTVYNTIKEDGLKQMGILQRDRDFFYNENDWIQLQALVTKNAEEYRRYEMLMRSDGTYLFPFELVEKNTNVVIYGAGAVGRSYYRQIIHTGYCNVLAWVDKRYMDKGKEVSSPCKIMRAEYSNCYIVLAINSPKIVKEIQRELLENGISRTKIIWRKPEIGL